jgi:hypothetical protein
MTVLKSVLLLTILSIFLVACKSTPILNINQSLLVKSNNLSNVTDGIIRAGHSLGWRLEKIKPGLIVATLNLRKHVAQVDINYNTESYSINYKDSKNLQYNEEMETIHSNYNGWVTNLSRAIDKQLY